MADTSDMDLLREYVDLGSESAFTQIVQRHIHLVYSVALRFTNNDADAQDITQAVFVILARKAVRLRRKTIVTGWLYETTRFTAMNFLTHKTRRQAREQEAYMQTTLNDAETDSIWPLLAPLLEGAMARLSEAERALVALRFFENKSIAETAVLAGMNEWAARKRVDRTMEKLRAYFSKRGVRSTAATIAGAISANSMQAAPAALIKTTTAVALAKGATASAATLDVAKGALKIMAWTKAKTAIVAGVAAILAVSATTTLIVHKSHRVDARMDFPRSSWKNAGYGDPVSALETLLWAASQSDGKTMFASLSPDLQLGPERGANRDGMSVEDYLSQYQDSAANLVGITGFQVVRLESVSNNEVHLHLVVGGKQGEQVFIMKRVGGEWKLDTFPRALFGS